MSSHSQKVLKTVSGDINGEMNKTMIEKINVGMKATFCILQTSLLQNKSS